ncbi:MAG: hypothetical protein ABH842_04760 [Candidatus Micrarchaeota archaeon]
MRKILLLLLLFSVIAFADTADEVFEDTTENSILEIANNWQVLTVLALIISITLVSIAYMFGSGLEMPELQAWAKTEFVQVFTNAIIVVALIATIAFIDLLVIGIMTDTGPDGIPIAGCNLAYGGTQKGSIECLQDVTEYYLDDQIYSNIKSNAKNVLDSNANDIQWIGRRFGLNCLSLIYCAQLGINMGFGGYYALYADMNAILFENYTTLLSFVGAQKFFVKEIAGKMGPVILAIGIVARSFFFSRKLGGLLMAVAIGAMFFFPGMYIFNWFTLQISISGDGVSEEYSSGCPAECKIPPPLAFVVKSGQVTVFNQSDEVKLLFNDATIAEQFVNGTLPIWAPGAGLPNTGMPVQNSSSPYSGGQAYSCNWGLWGTCPVGCRELPYPTAPDCIKRNHNNSEDINVPLSCALMSEHCKIKRTVQVTIPEEVAKCPTTCKVIPPLASDCRYDTTITEIDLYLASDNGDDEEDYDLCLQSSYDCRVTKSNNPTWRPTKENADDDAEERCERAQYCNADINNAENNCVYVLPPTGVCNDLCGTCKPECRIQEFLNAHDGSTYWNLVPSSCRTDDGDGDDIISDCNSCPDGCKVDLDELEDLKIEAMAEGECTLCPAQKMILSNSPALPVTYTAGLSCGLDICPSEYRLAIPRTACEMCIFAEEEYMYSPPINAHCQDLCKPANTRPDQDLSTFTKVGDTGLVGRPVITDLAKYMVPVYLLPLFNVVATLIFIRSLSHTLGGDIEIPGLSKVF